jgi:hypothetical protein
MKYIHECPYCGKRYECQREFDLCFVGLYWACLGCKRDAPILHDVPVEMFHEKSPT